MLFLVIDFYSVRMRPYPEEVHEHDWMIVLFPLLALVVLGALKQNGVLPVSVAVMFGATVLGLLISFPLIATVGVWFHFAIGGSL